MASLCTSILELHVVKTLESTRELVEIEKVVADCESKAFKSQSNEVQH
jgi:hypothetical protein